MKVVLTATVLLLLAACAAVGNASDIDEWVKNYLKDHEQLICQQQRDDDFFFVALSGDRLKTGHRVNVTGRDNTPKSFIISWRFQDGEGEYIGVKIAPEVLKRGYSKDGETMFAEEISYRAVHLQGVEKVQISVALSKYENKEDTPDGPDSADKDLETVLQCTGSIR